MLKNNIDKIEDSLIRERCWVKGGWLEDTKVVLDPEREMAILQQGELREKRKTVIKLFKMNWSIADIIYTSDLSEAEVKRIIEEYCTRNEILNDSE